MDDDLQFFLQSLAGWTFAFDDYYKLNITQYVDHPNLQKMAAIIDPYSKFLSFKFQSYCVRWYVGYLDRYKNTKMFQIQTAGDEFFILDNEVKATIENKTKFLHSIYFRMHFGRTYKLQLVVHF
jgi:PhoPQ-activated pathogenicity-related protein